MKTPFLIGTEQCWWWVRFYTLFPIWQECVTHYQGKAEINDKGINSISEIKSIIRMLLYTWLQNRKTAIPTLVLIEKIIISNTWDTVFSLSKHLEFCQKYFSALCIFNSLLARISSMKRSFLCLKYYIRKLWMTSLMSSKITIIIITVKMFWPVALKFPLISWKTCLLSYDSTQSSC